jgi:hypothetical protein
MPSPPEIRRPWASWQRRHLELCWRLDCDIDPLILRARLLHRQHARALALSIEQELLPVV